MAFRRVYEFVRLCIKALLHDPTSHSKLDNLPVEILLCIAESLGAADVVSLSLSNHRLHRKLGSSCYTVSTRQRTPTTKVNACDLESRRDLLHRLARDDSRFYICSICSRLHPLKAIGPPIWCVKCAPHIWERIGIDYPYHVFDSHRWPTAYQLNFDHVQCVMARHRSGRGSGHALEILQACEIADPRGSDSPTTLLSVEPAILNDELHLRNQQWTVVIDGQIEMSVALRHLSVCSHFNKSSDTLQPILECKLRHHETSAGCGTCHPYLRCTRCHIEFNIETRDLYVDGCAIIVTKWLRLGLGLSSADPHWRSHAMEAMFLKTYVAVAASDDGSLHEHFERQAKMGMDALTAKHESLLRSKHYRRILLHAIKSDDPVVDDFGVQAPRVERGAHRYDGYPPEIY